jgi:hypothetical protein
MQLELSVESRDPNVEGELTKTEIADDVSIHVKGHILREIVGIPELTDFVVYVGEKIALPVAAALLAKFLYDKLKDRQDNKLTINHKSIEINADKIEQLIIISLKEKEE